MTIAALLEDQLFQFRNDVECILENSKFTIDEDFFKKICIVCQNCDAGNKSYTGVLSNLHDSILALLSKRILSLEQQLIATKAFLYTQNYFIDNLEHRVDFLVQLSQIDENNKTLVYDLRSKEGNQTKFSSSEDVSLFKSCFYYHFSNSLKDKPFLSSLCSRPQSQSLLRQIINFCKLQNHLTSIAFKTLVNFLSSFSQCKNDEFFSEDLLVNILNLILANWENSIPGVKENNLILFRLFLSVKKNKISDFDCLSTFYNDLSWNMKSKYLMFMEILTLNKGSVQTIDEDYPDLIPKLLEGMKINYLVSACTELYSFIVGCIDFEQWKKIFFERLIVVLSANHINEYQKWNILSHWMVKTQKKFPKSIENVLFTLNEKKSNQNASCSTLLAIVMCLKILRKQGIKNYKEFDDFKEWETILQEGLQHIDERIRSESFNLICSCTKTTVEPTETEFMLVLQFIIENVNFDSSFQRQNLLTSFVIFLERLKHSSMSKLSKKVQTAPDLQSSNICWLFQKLIPFLSQNLAAGSNYQRKITSLKLLKISAEFCFSHDFCKVFTQYLTDELLYKRLFECILCETDDVNETAAQIIILYIQNGFQVPINLTISDCLLKINSDPIRHFASNEMLLKVCLIKEVKSFESNSGTVLLSNTILIPLLQSIQHQLKLLFQDSLIVASTGSLYCSLKATSRLISSKETYLFFDFNPQFCSQLLVTMEKIVQHLLKSLTSKESDDIDFAPSFAEMGVALEKQIQSSELLNASKNEVNEDGILLSSAYQSLLCCIWRNLQACCDLSVSLAIAYSQDLTEEEVLRCGKLVSNILMQCRHKGAIEAAGVALGRFISFIIKTNNERYMSWIDELLAKVFKLLTSESSKTISRRSAGLSILIHRLAVNDNRHHHAVIGKIVPVLLDIAEVAFEENDLILKDLPQAQALHLLCKIVEDSSLKLSVAPSLNRIVLVLCSSIASPVWGIRNAALQLCGAVILKILGRNKTQETECLVNTTYEQLFSHHEYLMPILLESFANPLKEDSDKVIFLLTILSHTSIQTDSDSIKSKNQQFFLVKLRELVHQFVSHKNLEIRRLAAISYVNLFPVSKYISVAREAVSKVYAILRLDSETVIKQILKDSKENSYQCQNQLETEEPHNENFVHGYLLIFKFVVIKFKKENGFCGYKFSFFSFICKLTNLSSSDLCSFFQTLNISATPASVTFTFPVKSLIYEICRLLNFTCCAHEKSDEFLECEMRNFTKFVHSHDPHDTKHFGVSIFAEELLKCLVARHQSQHMGKIFWFCSMNYSHNLIDVCLKSMKLDKDSAGEMLTRCFKFLSVGFFAGDVESRMINITVMEFMISVFDAYKDNIVGNVDASLDDIKNFSSTFIQADSEFTSKAILVTSGFLYLYHKNYAKDTENSVLFDEIFLNLIDHIPKLRTSNFEETRLNIAKSLYYLSKLDKLSPVDKPVCTIWESIVYMLQDEEFSIRKEMSEVVSSFGNVTFVLNPFVALMKVIQPSVMLQMMEPELVIKSYWNVCTVNKTSIFSAQSSVKNNDKISNPFNYMHYNFYLEKPVVLKAIFTNFCVFLREELKFEICDEMDLFSAGWQLSMTEHNALLGSESSSNLKRVISQLYDNLEKDFKTLETAISETTLKNSPSLISLHLKSQLSSILINNLRPQLESN